MPDPITAPQVQTAVPAPAAPHRSRGFPPHGQPIIHKVNRLGLATLYMKEVRRFFKVQTQTIWAPAITTLLFLIVFTVALGREDRLILGVPFRTQNRFLAKLAPMRRDVVTR